MFIKYNQHLKERSRDHRSFGTKAEKRMWYELLRKDKTGYRFLRQKPINHFILDFYCSQLLLGIEVDGDSHEGREEYDEERSEILKNLGIKVIRYKNEDVLENLEKIYEHLMKQIQLRKKETEKTKRPLDKGGRGI